MAFAIASFVFSFRTELPTALFPESLSIRLVGVVLTTVAPTQGLSEYFTFLPVTHL